jgi:hypothetical protein
LGSNNYELRTKNYELFQKVCEAVRANHSVLVVGEAGMGGAEFAQSLYEELLGDFQAAIATYKGSVKKFFTAIAFQLDIPTTETQYNKNGDPTGEKNLTVDALKEEIAANCSDGTLLILPEAKRLTTSIRYWLEDLMANGVVVVCFAAANPGRDMGYGKNTCKIGHDVKFCQRPCIYIRGKHCLVRILLGNVH